MPRGTLPTGMLATTLSEPASMTVTLFECSLETYTSGSAPALSGTVPSVANESSATPILPSAIASPPSRREPAPAIRHPRAERVEVFPAHVRYRRERPAAVFTLARPGHVERLPELVIPPAKRERLALVAVERRRRLHERDEGVPVAGAGPHHGLPGQIEVAPRPRPARRPPPRPPRPA